MNEKMTEELLQLRSKSLLETFTRCAGEHMMLIWIHGKDEGELQGEVLMDPMMLADVCMSLGKEEADKWCDEVRAICHETIIKLAAMYADAVCEPEE